ncbi:uncharacterized protein LOC113164261 isoform X2 [Anabas testudineus]|uniref:uncharacterized protein LOC113164261 isoform X2 n=1 Tax=Anabas testudineus TaxID=64144 RepID=UPI000E45BCB7|nr:uncharacterized protein LOC113164261 isoform X2 [Anabas testudineus]
MSWTPTEAIVKSPWREPYVTQVCSNDTLNIITLIVCKVRTKKSEGEVCRLLYQHGQDLKYECGSRFRFMTENQTVFLQLTSLTPDDSGNLTCKCSHAIGTNTDHLNNTMEGDGQSSTSPLKMLAITTMIGVLTAFTIVTGFVLGLALKKKYCRYCTRTGPSGLSVCGTTLDKDEPDEHYASLEQPASDVYQDVSSMQRQRDRKTNSANNPAEREMDGREIDHTIEIYENI